MIDFYMSDVQSPVCERVAIMLEECELKYEEHIIPVGKQANKPAAFMKFNPRGTVPTLVDRSDPRRPLAITQAGAILLYLAEKTGQFLPTDLRRRAQTYQWLMHVLTDSQPISMAAFLCERAVPDKVSSAVAFFESTFVKTCEAFEDALARSTYLGGDEPSIADFALYPTAFYRRPLIERAAYLHRIIRWMETMAKRAAVQRVFQDSVAREARLSSVVLK